MVPDYAELIARTYHPEGWAVAEKCKRFFEHKLAERRQCKTPWSRLRWWLHELWQEDELAIAASAPLIEHYRVYMGYNGSAFSAYKDWTSRRLEAENG